MKLNQANADIFIPDGFDLESALTRISERTQLRRCYLQFVDEHAKSGHTLNVVHPIYAAGASLSR